MKYHLQSCIGSVVFENLCSHYATQEINSVSNGVMETSLTQKDPEVRVNSK